MAAMYCLLFCIADTRLYDQGLLAAFWERAFEHTASKFLGAVDSGLSHIPSPSGLGSIPRVFGFMWFGKIGLGNSFCAFFRQAGRDLLGVLQSRRVPKSTLPKLYACTYISASNSISIFHV